MSELSRSEQETHYNFSAQDRADKILHAYSDDPIEIRRLEALGLVADDTGTHGGKHFKIDLNLYRLSVGKKRVLSDERRAELRKRFADARKTP